MKEKPKILTFNLRFSFLLLLCLGTIAFYFGWTLVLSILSLVCAVLLFLCLRYKIGSVGIDSHVLGPNVYRYVFLVKLANFFTQGSLPSKSDGKDRIRVFTFGLFLLADHGKMRAGFLKRHQQLARV